MLTPQPLVSVIIPVYNGDRYLAQAIQSAIEQSYPAVEIIVVDDGSTDETRQVLQPYGDKIRYIYQNNQGVAAARNRGIQEARGELIAFLDQDDFFLPDKLANQVSLFQRQPSLGIVNSGWRLVNEAGTPISEIEPWNYFPKLDLETWVVHMPVLPSAMMFSRQWLDRVGGFDSYYDSVDDSDLVLRLALAGCEAAWLPQVTVCYRQHDRNVSIQKALKQANLFIELKQNFFSRTDLPKTIQACKKQAFYEALTWMAWQLYYSGHPTPMAEFFQKSLDYTPYSQAGSIIDWGRRLTAISKAYGCEISSSALRNLPAWKQLMASITSKKVRVSVVIPTYNCETYIVQAVESILQQDYKDYEIIVVDDGSIDGTRQVLEPYLDGIQYIYQDNQGAAIARNRGCQVAKGELLAFLDGDDFFLPGKLEKQVACFDRDPELGMVQTGWLIVDENGQDIHGVAPWQFVPTLDLETLVMHKLVRPSAMMLQRTWWEKLGGFDSRFPPTEDLDFALRLALKGCKSIWVEEVLTCYRQHGSNLMSGGTQVMKNMEIVMERFFARPDLPEKIRQLKSKERYKCLTWMAWRMYRDGYLAEMVECLEKSLQYTSFSTATETILNWIETFKGASVEYGFQFEVTALTGLKEWQAAVAVALKQELSSTPVAIAHKYPSRIVVYAEDHGVGGLAQFNHSLLCELAAEGYRVTCVQTQTSNPLIDRQKQLGIEHIWLEYDTMREFSRIAYNQTDAEKIFTQVSPDLIIFSDGWPMANFAAKQVAINWGIPYIISLGYIDNTFAKFTRGDGVSYLDAVAYQYGMAQSVIAVSQENLDLFEQIFKLSLPQGKVIYYGRPPEYFAPASATTRARLRQELGIPKEAIVCFTAARLTPIKGYQYQVQAIAQLKQRPIGSKLYFVWAGPGASTHDNMEPELREKVQKLGVSDRVKFIGQRWDIANWLDTCDIFVLTSEAEGMPLAVMEAMAKGVPVIASAVSGIPEELGETGKLIPAPKIDPEGTVRELVSTLETWANDANLRQAIGQAEKQRAQKLFTEQRMLQDYLAVIEDCLTASSKVDTVPQQPELLEKMRRQESRLRYNALVWQAWYAYYQGNSGRMVQYLKESLACTPFLTSETLMKWVESFATFSGEKGIPLDTYSLANSLEWQELMEAVYGLNFPLAGLSK